MNTKIRTLAKTEPVFLTNKTYSTLQEVLSRQDVDTTQLISTLLVGEYLDLTVSEACNMTYFNDYGVPVIKDEKSNTVYKLYNVDDAKLNAYYIKKMNDGLLSSDTFIEDDYMVDVDDETQEEIDNLSIDEVIEILEDLYSDVDMSFDLFESENKGNYLIGTHRER